MPKKSKKPKKINEQDHELLRELGSRYGEIALLRALADDLTGMSEGTLEEASYKLGRKRQLWTRIGKDEAYGAEVLNKAADRLQKRGIGSAPL